MWVLDHNLPIDTEYYLTNQLSNPLTRIFEPIIPNPQTLLSGEHTRTVCKPTPKGGGIMNFAVKKETCMGCRTLVSAQDKIPGEYPACWLDMCCGNGLIFAIEVITSLVLRDGFKFYYFTLFDHSHALPFF